MNRGLKMRLGTGVLNGLEVALWYAVAEYMYFLLSMLLRPHRLMLVLQWRALGYAHQGVE